MSFRTTSPALAISHLASKLPTIVMQLNNEAGLCLSKLLERRPCVSMVIVDGRERHCAQRAKQSSARERVRSRAKPPTIWSRVVRPGKLY